ncbi:hypothetical protein ACFS07_11050 [Undibacterium arcticum]
MLQAQGKTAPNKRAAKTQTGQRRQGVKAVGSRAIPSTGGDFWTKLITDQPQSAPDILKAAIAQLGMTPSQDLNAKLSARMTNALTQLVKSKQIKDSGARRERRFFSSSLSLEKEYCAVHFIKERYRCLSNPESCWPARLAC